MKINWSILGIVIFAFGGALFSSLLHAISSGTGPDNNYTMFFGFWLFIIMGIGLWLIIKAVFVKHS